MNATEPQDATYKVLFICTGNSARSIMAEALMNRFGLGRFRAWSAGSHPTGEVKPLALQTLAGMRVPAQGLYSKNWNLFAQPEAPEFDFVFTVCDNAAGEACPVWPGQPMTAHWGVPDPAAIEGSEEDQARGYLDAAITLKRRIELLMALPIESLDRFTLRQRVSQIGQRAGHRAATQVLVLCTHNSARSVLAEGMLNHLARSQGRSVQAHSAGSQPSGRINPMALRVLAEAGIDTAGFRSKSWDEFTGSDAPPIHIVITVCDSAAAETCPVFHGGPSGVAPLKTHWGYPDPSNAEGGEEGKRRAFELTRQALGFRMQQLLDLVDMPEFHEMLQGPARAELQGVLARIGRS